MKEKFDISKFNARLATLIIIFTTLGIATIFLENSRWLKANYYGFTEVLALFVGIDLFVMPFLFVFWVISWVVGRRKKDVDHIDLPIWKGVATIVLFFGFFAVLNVQSGTVQAGVVLDTDGLNLYDRGGQYYVEFVGEGKNSENEIIALQVTKAQYEEIGRFEDTALIEYEYNTRLPGVYHFVEAKSNE